MNYRVYFIFISEFEAITHSVSMIRVHEIINIIYIIAIAIIFGGGLLVPILLGFQSVLLVLAWWHIKLQD